MFPVFRYDIINHFIKKYGYKSYLEIGVAGGNCFRAVDCFYKVGVDPNNETTFVMTSDEFFEKHNEETFDIVFIDGLHMCDQVEFDIINSLRVLNPGGTIICHDMNPTTEDMQIVPPRVNHGDWTGDCWKAWMRFRCLHEDLEMTVIDTDYGVGIIRKGKQKRVPVFLNTENLTYNDLDANRVEWLNLMSWEQYLNRG